MSAPMPPSLPPDPGALSPAKKGGPLVWILGGIAAVLCLGMVACGIFAYVAMRAVKNAGFDPDLMKSNPGLALTKMAANLHPDMEVVSTNERTGLITMREKSTGKVMTMRWDPDKKTMAMTGDDGKEVTFAAGGDGKSLDVKTSDGSAHFGAGNSAPAWVPVYPGSSPEGTYSAKSRDGTQNMFTFKTSDPPAKVISYYQDQLKGAGFTVNLVTSGEQGGIVQAENAGKTRTVMLTVSSGDGTQGSVVAVEKP